MGKEEKDKKKDKDKKDKDKKDKDKKDKVKVDQDWKIPISKNLDNLIIAYGKIVNIFKDIDNYILKDVETKEELVQKIHKAIEDLPEPSKRIFLAFLENLP